MMNRFAIALSVVLFAAFSLIPAADAGAVTKGIKNGYNATANGVKKSVRVTESYGRRCEERRQSHSWRHQKGPACD
jgi:hypothetical protein